LAPSDWAIVWAIVWGWFGGVCYPRAIDPNDWPGLDRAGFGGLTPFSGGDWRGFAAIGAGWFGPRLIGAGLAPGRLGGAGRLAPDHANPGGLCNDFPVILPFL